ncbi:C2H2 transcription factor RfeC [Arthroderma uncinatum]|uniref:C2H2 transcription factor RfeC n=1 Tax=Arthroderma uncinatum TaxID=74035 RepID=UPI00144ADDCC|nr:C2H2 transcription factor RfeC [Arthroderma uncinatum]KAF3484312.1 C2H2 transcription factor RfeC [Arthroderma uncinatum]
MYLPLSIGGPDLTYHSDQLPARPSPEHLLPGYTPGYSYDAVAPAPTTTTTYSPDGLPQNIAFHQQYLNPPPLTTDPKAYQLIAQLPSYGQRLDHGGISCGPSNGAEGKVTAMIPTALPFQDLRKRVVGSQGRRGILPSTNLAERAGIPDNTDGRFPCPRCSKTYLHEKHLRRLFCVILESDPTCVSSVKTPSREATPSNVTSGSVPSDGATQPD